MKNIYLYFKRKVDNGDTVRWYRKWLFLGLGITSTIWFLIRVIPKPSRASYPCIQTAAPLMSAFVLYILSFSGVYLSYRKLMFSIKKRRYVLAITCSLSALFFAGVMMVGSPTALFAQMIAPSSEPKMAWGRLNPVGVAKGIHLGRVSWSHAPGASAWEKGNGHWYEDKWNSQEATDWMVCSSLLSLTGEKTEKAAWHALFISFNQQQGKGEKGYIKGERLSIKINMNNTFEYQDNEQLNASPHLTLSLLRSLINKAGIPQEMVTVCDPSRFITNALFHKCQAEFPNIIYMDNEGTNGRTKATYTSEAIPYSVDNGRLARGLCNAVIQSDYLINIALLKGHGGQGVTLCAKNWYGVTDIHRDFRQNQHNHFNQDRGGKPRYMTFTDYIAHKDLGGKTMLYMIDALYGSEKVNGEPSAKWKMEPFRANWPCSLFVSQDGVAIDAVGIDFLCAEFPRMADVDYCDMYLVEAATAGNPPSGTSYDPERDGTSVSSLGVLEHWNNPVDKQYSRNLGQKKGIELVYIKRNKVDLERN